MSTDVMDLYGKIKLDTGDYKKALENCSSGMAAFSEKMKAGFGAISKAGAAAMGAASTAISATLKQSIDAYGDYEQYIGGIEKLFGDSASTVISNANEAFKTAGLSANEYMETTINFSGALLKSVGNDTAKAAELVQTAITDMSDQANTYGKTVSQISDTYTSLSRGNYQTLDNLFGGMFAGTKAGLNEMLEYAENYRAGLGETVDYSADSYADIVQAIHDVSEATNVYGTTSKEAAGTLQGSTGAMKAAWANLKVELVKENGDIKTSIGTLADSALTVFGNIEPKIMQSLGGISELIQEAAPMIAQKVPEVINEVLPPLLSSAGSLVSSVGKSIIDSLPGLANTMFNEFKTVDLGGFNWIRDDIVSVVNTVKNTISNINFGDILSSVSNFTSSFSDTFQKFKSGFSWLSQNVFTPLIEWGSNEIFPKIFNGMAASINLVTSAFEFLETPAKAVWNEFLQPIAETTGELISGSLGLISDGLTAISNTVNGVDWSGFWIDLFSGDFGENWKAGWTDIKENIENAGNAIDEFFDVSEFGASWNHFWQGVGSTIYDAISKMKTVGKEFIDTFTLGLEAIDDIFGSIKENIGKVTDGISGVFQGDLGEWVYDKVHGDESFARGAIVTRPTRALIGEAGTEAVIPLENNTQFIDTLSSMIGGHSEQPVINVTQNFAGAYIGDETLARKLVKPMSEELQRVYNRNNRSIGGVFGAF